MQFGMILGASEGHTSVDDTSLIRLSICIVAHNEEDNIERAISSVIHWADEVIVLDCESVDSTADVALAAGATLHKGPNLVPEANKNRCFEYARGQWILILDADEIIPKELQDEIDSTIQSNPSDNAFRIPRRNFYFGTPLMHGGNYPDKQIRLFRRNKGKYPGVDYHEKLIVEGSIGDLTMPFDHHPYPTFEVWYKEFDRYSRHEAMRFKERGIAITPGTIRRYMIGRPMRRWLKRLFLKRGVKDGVPGVLAATFDLMNQVIGFGRYWIEENKRKS